MGGVSRWFLQGVLLILVCFVVVIRGEVAVDCVVNRGGLCGVFQGRKTCHFFVNFSKIFQFGRAAPNSQIFDTGQPLEFLLCISLGMP